MSGGFKGEGVGREATSSSLWMCSVAACGERGQGRAGKKATHTLSDASDGFVLVAVGLLESEEDIGLGPVRKHLADYRCLVAVLLSKLAKVAFVFKCSLRVVGFVVSLVAIGSTAASTGETSSTTTAGASAARGGRP